MLVCVCLCLSVHKYMRTSLFYVESAKEEAVFVKQLLCELARRQKLLHM